MKVIIISFVIIIVIIFQKFEIISFETFNYKGMKFNILDGFRDNSNPIMLKGDNKFLCNYCNKLQEAEKTCKIFEPSQKLLINIDYEKKEKYHPSVVEFDEEIDITNFVDFDYKKKIKYKIIGVCTCFEHHQWLAFCRNKKTINGINLTILHFLNVTKEKFIKEFLIYCYMK